ncbi:protein singed wings 2-like [Dermatophagoides pteronyssinus]|uniref:protein singed wings 2-like n=1 Tax=Dermatophagoides pteronyssinus TaxID=6956 RepID=UPI003F673264
MMVVLTVILMILSSTIHSSLSFNSFNITDDLINNNNPINWLCWDRLFNHPSDGLSNCNCFINITCTTNNNALVNNDRFLIWLRCYNLKSEHDSNLLNQFHQILPQNVIELTGKDPNQCISPQQPNNLALRTDFIQCDENIVIPFLDQLETNTQTNQQHYKLESLTIKQSGLTEINNDLAKHFGKSLRMLSLMGNQLTTFDTNYMTTIINFTNTQLTEIDLSNNRLNRINLSQFTSLRSINISQNNLSTLAPSDLNRAMIDSLEKMDNEKALLDLSIGNNPWNCDQRIDWLVDLISEIVEKNGRLYFFESSDGNSVKDKNRVDLFRTNEPECNQPDRAKMFPFSVWKSVKESDICQTCSCCLTNKHAKAGYRYLSVNCSGRNLESLPNRLPKNTKVLDLSGNRIRNLNPLSKYHHGELSKWAQLSRIILSNNLLESLDGLESIRSIIYLDISGNLLTEIPYHIVNKVLSSKKMDKLQIGNNPYVCDCNTVKFQKWLHNYYRIIMDIEQIRCGELRPELLHNESLFNAGSGGSMIEQARQSGFLHKEILEINSLHLCPIADTVIDALDLINIVLAISILLLIIKVTYDYLWQKRTGKLPRFFKLNI